MPTSSTLAPQNPLASADRAIMPFNLVLEGGAMRGLFTAGVLDFLMEKEVWAQHTIGTSAGALNGYNYVAGAQGRTAYINIKYCSDWRYLSLRSYVSTGDAYGVDFSFNEIPNVLEPFDDSAFYDSPMKLTTVASDLELGEADYHVHGDRATDTPYLVASSAMPLVSRITEVDGKHLLDGGVCDSVAIIHSMLTGADKHVVVLTQDAGYIKPSNKLMALAHQRYAPYPYFVDRMANRHFEYNRCMRMLARMHDAGKAFIIRPPVPVAVKSMESDPEKLLNLYEQGYAEAAGNWNALQAYLEA